MNARRRFPPKAQQRLRLTLAPALAMRRLKLLAAFGSLVVFDPEIHNALRQMERAPRRHTVQSQPAGFAGFANHPGLASSGRDRYVATLGDTAYPVRTTGHPKIHL
jgi:hypothetical protein